MTTFNSYGEVPQHRQTEVFDELRMPNQCADTSNVEALAKALLETPELEKILQSNNPK